MVVEAKSMDGGRQTGSEALFKGLAFVLEIGPRCDFYTSGHRGGRLGMLLVRFYPSMRSSGTEGSSRSSPTFSSWWREEIDDGSGCISFNKLELSPDQ